MYYNILQYTHTYIIYVGNIFVHILFTLTYKTTRHFFFIIYYFIFFFFFLIYLIIHRIKKKTIYHIIPVVFILYATIKYLNKN